MIRLDLPREPSWLDLPHGVRVRARPLDTALDAAARDHAVRETRGDDGGPPPGAPPESWRRGRVKAALVRALAAMCVFEWEGVLTSDGEPAPLTAGTLADLMDIPDLADAFLTALYAPLDRLVAEGEGCAPSPHGVTAGARTIAPDAGPQGPTAADAAPR